MKDALSKVYSRYSSPWSAIFGPALTPRTYLRTLHLLLMFPLGIAYFVALVTALSIGGAMIWTIVGPLVLIPTLFLTRWAGDAEAWAVRHVAQIELRRPPTANRARAVGALSGLDADHRSEHVDGPGLSVWPVRHRHRCFRHRSDPICKRSHAHQRADPRGCR